MQRLGLKKERLRRSRLAFEQLESRHLLAAIPVPTSLALLTAPQTLSVGTVSGILKVELLDQFKHLVKATSNVTVNLSASDGGSFLSYPSNSPVTSVTILKGATTASFRYTDTLAGTPTITVAAASLAAGTQTETILAGRATQVLFVDQNTPPGLLPTQAITAGDYNPVTIELADAYGNPALATAKSNIIKVTKTPHGPVWSVTTGTTAGQEITLFSDSPTGEFFTDTDSTTPVNSMVIPAGQSTLTFYYEDSSSGTSHVFADGAGLAAGEQTETVEAVASQIVFVPPGSASSPAVTFTVGAGSPVTLQMEDPTGAATTVLNGATITLTTSSSTGVFSGFNLPAADAVDGSGTNTVTITVPDGTPISSLTFTYTDTTYGPVTLAAQGATGDGPLTAGTQADLVLPVAASQIVFVPPGSVASPAVTFTDGQASPVTVQLEDATGAPTTIITGGTISLTTTNATGVFSGFTLPPADTVVGSGTNSVTITVPTGTPVSSLTFTYTDTTDGPVTLSANATSGAVNLTLGTQADQVVPVPTQIAFVPPGSVGSPAVIFTAGVSGAVTVQLEGATGTATTILAGSTITLTTSSSTGVFSGFALPAADTVVGSGTGTVTITVPVGTPVSSLTFAYTDTTPASAVTLTAQATWGATPLTSGTQVDEVDFVPASQIVFVPPGSVISPAVTFTAGVASPVTVQVESASNAPTAIIAGGTVILTTSSSTGVFSGFTLPAADTVVGSGTNTVTITVASGTPLSSLTFNYTDTTAGAVTLTANATSGAIVLTAGTQADQVVLVPATQIVFVPPGSPASPAVTFTVGVASPVTVQVEGATGAPTAINAGGTITLTTSHSTGVFSGFTAAPGVTVVGSGTNTVTITAAAGTPLSSLTFNYTDTTFGAVTLTANATSGAVPLTTGTQADTVAPVPATQIAFVPPGSVASPAVKFTYGLASPVTVQVQSATGAPTSIIAGATIKLTTSHSTGVFSGFTLPAGFSVAGSGTNTVIITVAAGTPVSSITFNYTDKTEGAVILTATLTSGATSLKSGTQNDVVVPPPSIGISFAENRTNLANNTANVYKVTGTAGVLPIGDWNNIANYNVTKGTVTKYSDAVAGGAFDAQAAGQKLVNNSGLATTAVLSSFTLDRARDTFNKAEANQDAQLMNSYLDSTTKTSKSSVTITNIPYAHYTVYVYVGSATNGHKQSATVGSKTYFYATDSKVVTSSAGYVTTTNTNAATFPKANYLVFSGLTSSTLTVTAGDDGGAGGIMAIEIVAAP